MNFSQVSATIDADDNTQYGEISMQAKVVDGGLTLTGETETLVVQSSFAAVAP